MLGQFFSFYMAFRLYLNVLCIGNVCFKAFGQIDALSGRAEKEGVYRAFRSFVISVKAGEACCNQSFSGKCI